MPRVVEGYLIVPPIQDLSAPRLRRSDRDDERSLNYNEHDDIVVSVVAIAVYSFVFTGIFKDPILRSHHFFGGISFQNNFVFSRFRGEIFISLTRSG